MKITIAVDRYAAFSYGVVANSFSMNQLSYATFSTVTKRIGDRYINSYIGYTRRFGILI